MRTRRSKRTAEKHGHNWTERECLCIMSPWVIHHSLIDSSCKPVVLQYSPIGQRRNVFINRSNIKQQGALGVR